VGGIVRGRGGGCGCDRHEGTDRAEGGADWTIGR
jgi:hypothetical protein